MSPVNVQIRGLDRLVRKMDKLAQLESVKAGLKAGALHLKGAIAEYPPSSEANQPSQQRWYERGFGPKWRVRSGAIHSRHSSETLGRKWTVKGSNSNLTWRIGNNVSYGIYVQSAERQVWFHKKRGWKTDERVVKDESKTVNEFVAQYVRKALEKSEA